MSVDLAAKSLSGRLPVEQRVNLTLQQSPYISLRRVKATQVEGKIVLTGELPNFHMKQLAQTLAKHVEGVRHLDNRTQVRTNA